MKTLKQYILEEKDKDKDKKDDSKKDRRRNIKFTIWEEPDKKVQMIESNEKYQKIEYKHEDKDKGISIDFLLGNQEGVWKLWIGKIGSCSYDDDPYCSFDTEDFKRAIVMSLDKVEEFLDMVEDDPQNYVQYYIHR